MPSDLAPAFLVAMDSVLDPNFRRSVVLMIHHDPGDGAIGLVVNRGTDLEVSDLCENLEIPWSGARVGCVDWGGPVSPDEGWVLFGGAAPAGVDVETVTDALHWSRSRDALRAIAEAPELRARVFLGYAGWGPGQLEGEIAAGSWIVVPLSERLVFDEAPERLWDLALRSLGIDPAMLVAAHGVN